MSKVKMLVQWGLVALFAFCALGWMPTMTSVLFLLGAVILLPVKPIEELMEKFKLKLAVRIVISVILMAVAFSIAPDKAPATERKEQREKAASSSETKDEADNKKDSSDNKKDNKSENKKNESDKSDSKKNESDDSDIMAQISGTWHYSSPVAIDMFYTFYEDGTWEVESENDSENSGTYEIVDGKNIVTKGRSIAHNFTIKNSDELTDDEGRDLTRYVPDNDN